MKRRILQLALVACAVSLTLFVASCTTVETRIAEKQESFRRMSPTDQTLVQRYLVAKSDRDALKGVALGAFLCVPAWAAFIVHSRWSRFGSPM